MKRGMESTKIKEWEIAQFPLILIYSFVQQVKFDRSKYILMFLHIPRGIISYLKLNSIN